MDGFLLQYCQVNFRKKSAILDSIVTIQGKQMRYLRDGKSYVHLGMPIRHWVKPEETICGIMQDARKLDLSLLDP